MAGSHPKVPPRPGSRKANHQLRPKRPLLSQASQQASRRRRSSVGVVGVSRLVVANGWWRRSGHAAFGAPLGGDTSHGGASGPSLHTSICPVVADPLSRSSDCRDRSVLAVGLVRASSPTAGPCSPSAARRSNEDVQSAHAGSSPRAWPLCCWPQRRRQS